MSISKKILVGLTTDWYVKFKKNTEKIQSYKIRKQKLIEFFKHEDALTRVLIEPIDDNFIPKKWDKLNVEAIVVTKDTILGSKKINSSRIEQGNSPLKIETFSLVKIDNKEHISSSKIRKGQVNREGVSYINPIWFRKKLFITEKLRKRLKKPFGEILKKDKDFRLQQCPYLITVGDVTTKKFNDLGINQDISVTDFKVERRIKFSNFKELGFTGNEKIFKIKNPAGSLVPSLFKTASDLFKISKKYNRIILYIEGEEDLAVLPLVLSAPLGSLIFYGQPGKGVVKVEVSEKVKKSAFRLVSQFREYA